MSVPRKYRHLGDFHKYYSGEYRAPVLTLVIGGNHEASNYLFELYHGGWLAHNIYYLGAAGVIRYGPWRIAGLSGIYDTRDYHKPHHERLPYDRTTMKSIYHVREYDVQKLLSVTGHVDIALSHDWPAWVELFGDYDGLYKSKPTFFESAKKDGLGSKAATQLLDHLRPPYWFSGHMHVRFAATVQHEKSSISQTIKRLPVAETMKAVLPVFKSKYTVAVSSAAPGMQLTQNDVTQFLALGKVGQDQHEYLDLLQLDPPELGSHEQPYFEKTVDGKHSLYYDEEWLAVTRAYNDSLHLTDPNTFVVPPAQPNQKPLSARTINEHRVWVHEHITKKELLKIPENFTAHAPIYSPYIASPDEQPVEYPNVQTASFANLLQIENKFEIIEQDDDAGDDDSNILFG